MIEPNTGGFSQETRIKELTEDSRTGSKPVLVLL